MKKRLAPDTTTVGGIRRLLWYSRKSWERDLGVNGDDLDIREWAHDQGYQLAPEAFHDSDASGLRPLDQLPALVRALELIEAGEAHALAVRRQDRLCCCPGFLLVILKRVWAVGGEVLSFEEGRFANDALAILGYQERAVGHALERIHAQQRRLNGKRRKGAHGGYIGGDRIQRRYGCQLIEADGHRQYVPIPAEQDRIRWMIDRQAEGWSLRKIADELTRQGVPTVAGDRKPWAHSTVQSILDRGPTKLTSVRAVPEPAYGERAPVRLRDVL